MQIICQNDTSNASFLADEQTAVNILDSTFTNNISVTIQVGFGDYRGTTLQNQNISEGDVNSSLCVPVSYQTLRSDLLTYGQPGFFNSSNLANGTSIDGVSNFYISSSVAACFGTYESGYDGYVGIGTTFTPGAERVSAFLHEICHALARVPETINGYDSELDLWRFTSAGNRLFSGTNPDNTFSYFSLDGGNTQISQWGQTSDSSDFRNGFPFTNDPFNESVGNLGHLTTADIEVMDALGFTSNAINPAPAAGTTAVMVMSNPNDGTYEIYDIGGNAILAAYALARESTSLTFVGLGTFQTGDTSDMLLRDNSTGAFDAYYISGNSITGSALVGTVGTNWNFAGVGNFDAASSLSELLLRNSGSGSFELYHVAGGGVLSGSSVAAVGNNFSVKGFGHFSEAATTQMMMQDNTADASAGQLELYTYQTSTASFAGINVGKVGSNLTIVGCADLLGNGMTQMVMQQNNGNFWLYSYNAGSNTLSGTLVGAIGSNFHVVGFGPLGSSGRDEMLMQDAAGDFEVYQYNAGLNAFVGTSMGAVGAPWLVDGIAPNASSGAVEFAPYQSAAELLAQNNIAGPLGAQDSSSSTTGLSNVPSLFDPAMAGQFGGVPQMQNLMQSSSGFASAAPPAGAFDSGGLASLLGGVSQYHT